MGREEEQKTEDEEEYFLSPTNDLLFKRIFADTKTTEPARSLLTGVLNEEVTDIRILNPEIPSSSVDLKGSVLDIRAVLNGTTHVNIEIQIWYQTDFMKRTQYYLSKLYESQIGPGERHANLHRAIVINFLCGGNYRLPKEKWHTTYIFKETDLNTPMPDGMLELHFVELEKVPKLGIVDEPDLLTKWVFFMTAKSMQEMKIIAEHEPAIRKAVTIVEEIAMHREERMRYESRQKFLRDWLTREIEAEERGEKKGREEGRAEGREEGRAEGLEIGEKKGREEGREEGLIEAAKRLIAGGMDKKEACRVLGISESDLL